MRRITLWLLSTIAAVVLLFSYRTSTGAAAPGTTVAQAPIGGAAPAPSSGSPADSGIAGNTKTYSGSIARTRWGPVQVSITVTGGRITDVAVPIYPNGNGRDQEINGYALPQLLQETLSAQDANIDGVSGATITSDGYKESLQAALDAAHIS